MGRTIAYEAAYKSSEVKSGESDAAFPASCDRMMFQITLKFCLIVGFCHVGMSFSSNISKSKTATISMSTVAMPVKPMNGLWNRLMFAVGLNKRVRTDEELKKGIANFYDESSQVWLDVWVSCWHSFCHIYSL